MTTVLLSIVAMILYYFLVCALLRLTGQKYSLTVLLVGALSIFATTLFIFGDRISFWHFASYFSVQVMSVIFVYGLALKSLSLRMLSVLAESPGATLKQEDLVRFVVRPAFLERIEVLIGRHLVTDSTLGYVATRSGVASAKKVLRWRNALKLNASGLYGA